MKLEGTFDSGVLPYHLGGAVVCVLLLGAGWVFGLGPLLSDSHQASSVIEQAAAADLEAREAKGRVDALTAKLATLEAELDKHPLSLSPASAINPLLAELARWTDEHDLAVTATNAGRPVALQYYDYVPISIAGEGQYANLLALLDRVNTERNDLGVVSFHITRLVTSAGVKFEIELAWYVVSDAPAGLVEPTAGVPTP